MPLIIALLQERLSLSNALLRPLQPGRAVLVRVFAKVERRWILSLWNLGVRPERSLRMDGIEPTVLAFSQGFARAPPYFPDLGVQVATRRSHRGRRMDSSNHPFRIVNPFPFPKLVSAFLLPATERIEATSEVIWPWLKMSL